MKRIAHLLSAVALALPLASHAIGTFQFDPDGAGAAAVRTVDLFDWAPGNALAVGGSPAFGLATGDLTKLLYQANLSVTSLGGVNNFANGLSLGNFISVVAGFEEVATVVGNTANFALTGTLGPAPSASNFFYIYANPTAIGDSLLGTGFTAGSAIMSGYVSSVSSSNFTYTVYDTSGTASDNSASCTNALGGTLVPLSATQANCMTILDRFGVDDWSPTLTMVGAGTTDMVLTITGVNSAYFPDLTPGAVLTTGFINTSQVDPFAQVQPSRQFSNDGIANGGTAANVGDINGFNMTTDDKNFIFQADANMSLERAIPEPGALALVGLALLGAGAASRRRFVK
jgi:hypothetical protein